MADPEIDPTTTEPARARRFERNEVLAAFERALDELEGGHSSFVVADGPDGSALVVGALPPGSAPGRARARLHAGVAHLLHGEGAPNAEVAEHLLGATGLDGPDEPWETSLLRTTASDLRSRGEHGRAAELLRAALRRCSEEERPEILASLGRAELAAGSRLAADRLALAIACRPELADDPGFCLDLGQAMYSVSRFVEAADAFGAGLDSARPKRPEVEAQLIAGLEMSSILAGRSVVRSADETSPDRSFAVRVRAAVAAGRHAVGVAVPEPDRCRGRVLELVDIAMPEGEPPAGAGTVVLEPLALALWIADEVDRCTAMLDQRLAESDAPTWTEATLLPLRGLARLAAGDLRGALADASRTIESAHGLPLADHQAAMAAAHVLAHAGLETGRIGEVAPLVDTLDPLLDRAPSPLRGWLHEARGQLALAADDFEDARTLLLTAGDEFRSAGGPGAFVAWRTAAARASHALGRRDEAADLLADELDLARAFGARRILSGALRASAALTPGGAVELLREAHDVVAGHPLELERAHVEVELGAALRRRNSRRDARRYLRTGLVRARRCGASALVREAADELERAGARPETRPTTGVDALTPAERRVARLAADGRSNPEIAGELFVSRKTVEVHLSSIYRKLGIRSRNELPDGV